VTGGSTISTWRGLAGLALCLLTASVASGGEVRVLLLESAAPVEVAGARIAPSRGGLVVDGRPVGPRFEIAGPGPHRAAGQQVRGAIVVERVPSGLQVINRVPLESYVAGTLAREVYSHWAPAALRAQAVATRTYALYRQAQSQGGAGYDLEAGTRAQVYGGAGAESAAANEAVADTRDEVLTWRGQPILAAFHSASGGRTAAAEEVWGTPLPYLRSRDVAGEEGSPDTYWRVRYTGITLGRALAPFGIRLGAVREARVTERTPSGRAARVVLSGTAGSRSVTARELRSMLGETVLRSTLFEIRGTADELVFVGSGYGHGVGMSQWGAQAMAERGADYREILATFYPGTTLERRGVASRERRSR